MQKVIRRTIMAEKQVARRRHKKQEALARDRRCNLVMQNSHRRKLEEKAAKDERIQRREEWEMGDIVPRRNVGDKANTYGTLDSVLLRGPMLTVDERHEILRKLKERYLTIVVGDNVVLLEGRDKGKIGKVKSKDISRGEIKVEGVNMVDVAVPEWMRKSNDSGHDKHVVAVEQPVPILSVRLVHPIKDRTTGETRDMIINRLVKSDKVFYDRNTNTASWHRMIPDLNIRIPWPKRDAMDFSEHPVDTLRIYVESRTFVPALLRPPMPSTIIDELRNKYSIFRTRHDPEYIEKKMAEDREEQAKKQMVKQMRTPLHDIRRKERKLRRAQGKGTLTRGMMERIGKVIAQKKQLLADAAGFTEPTPELSV